MKKTSTAPIIKVEHLTKKFGDFTAVDDISFEVAPGQILAFLGPNGAGKTTTIKMLTTLLDPTSGTISLNGFDPKSQQDQVRHSFGIVFQDPSLDDELTARENLEIHAVLYSVETKLAHQRTDQLLELVELSDRQDSLVKTFSGGMRRRLEIARGLLHHPKIFFLDEPTQGLDPQTRHKMWDYIQELNRQEGITVFFTTHYIEEAENSAQKVAIIDHGHIIATGSPKELMTQTKTTSLEKAYLQLTGDTIRTEDASASDQMRLHRRLWRR